MKIQSTGNTNNIPLQKICFMSKIIDAHAHIGSHNNQVLTKNDLDKFVKRELPNKDTVEKFLVSNIDVLHGIKNEYQGNLDTLKLFEKDNHYTLLASCNPKTGNVKHLEQLFDENQNVFAGLKFHTQIQKLELSDSRLTPYLEFANKNKIPCLFHCEVLLDKNGNLLKDINKYADPELIYNIAKKYKDTPFVLAHLGAGWNQAHDKAIDILISAVKNRDANLYADISWVDIDADNKNHILKAIKKLKGIGDTNWTYGDQSYRLIFGTDSPLSRFKNSEDSNSVKAYTKFVEDIKNAIKKDPDLCKDSEKIINDLFYNNAKKLYFKNIKKTPKKKNKHLLLIIGMIAVIMGSIGFISSKQTKTESKY